MSLGLKITDEALEKIRKSLDEGKKAVLPVEGLGALIFVGNGEGTGFRMIVASFEGMPTITLNDGELRSLVQGFNRALYPELSSEVEISTYRNILANNLKDFVNGKGEFPFTYRSTKERE